MSDLIAVATVVAGFGLAVLVFRIQRESEMRKAGEVAWIPLADWLLIVATLASLLCVVLPTILVVPSDRVANVAAAVCAGTVVLAAGYPLAILAHYELILGVGGHGDRPIPTRPNPTRPELAIVVLTALAAAILGVARFLGVWGRHA